MYSVLIVDDEYYICTSVASKLSRLGLAEIGEIRTCFSAEEALEVCRDFKPQIVITDIKMSGMNGIELIGRLGRMLFPVRFLVLSGYDDFGLVRNAFREGAVDYLLKPLLSPQLRDATKSVCETLKSDSHYSADARAGLFETAKDFRAVLRPEASEDNEKKFHTEIMERMKFRAFAVAVTAFAKPVEDPTALINDLYDSFDSGSEYIILCAQAPDDKIIILINLPEGGSPGALEALFEKAVLHFQEQNAPAAAALSETGCERDIRALYQQAESALSARLAAGYGKVYRPGSPGESSSPPVKFKKQIALLIGNPDILELNRFQADFKKQVPKMSAREMQCVYRYMTSAVKKELAEKDLEQFCPNFPDFGSFHNPDEFRETLFACLKSVTELLQEESRRIKTIVQLVQKYIDENFKKGITLSDLAQKFSLSYSYLSKLLSAHLGMPFMAYVVSLRMNLAVELLQDPELTVQEIAFRAGYDNLFNFSRAFKKQFGISPSQYRKSR